MPPFLPSSLLLPIPALTIPPPPPLPPHHHLRRFLPAPLAAAATGAPPRRPLPAPLAASSRPPPRQPYRRRRTAPPPPTRAPPSSSPQQPQERPANAAARTLPDARGQEELEAAIYDFMRRSAKPGAFPTREELVAAGRADLAAAVASSGGWLSLGWSSGAEGLSTTPSSSGGGHPDYPPAAGIYDRNLAPGAGGDAGSEEVEEDEEEASPSGRQPETEETRFKAGLEGMLTRLQRDRERARPLPRRSTGAGGQSGNSGTGVGGRSDNGVEFSCVKEIIATTHSALVGNNSAPSHTAGGSRYTPWVPENENIHGSHPHNGTLEGNNTLRSSSNDAWQTWTLGKGGLSDFEAAEVLPTESRKLSEHDSLDIAMVEDHIHRSSNGVAVSDYPSDAVDSERDEIHSRLQNLELDLSAALKTLRSRFDKVLSDMSTGDGTTVLVDVSDDWEFEETKVMQAQEELRSIRAKIAVLDGKMALEIIERNKIIEDKQRRLDEVEKALSELRTVYIVWPNPASEVLLVGSFDGWTSQRKLERSERGIFSINLRLYPGRYEIKFIVDGVWKNDLLRPTVYNNGHENNLLVVT
ncbi:protein FLOURY ENDOSPERM 6, chloroplastic-like isoform X2 [Phragmites australis]|uniref:protein FLOURY ENDOSPERM 6, chloroplastic-like isoform X2 n=1 Tax=Phragmites australis TaxID=29695 RepID=UPI002D78F519|nr:protein FLOURY ENDOSPERM 6, chloroplastic-like isoform X2 [Phragmites australis]